MAGNTHTLSFKVVSRQRNVLRRSLQQPYRSSKSATLPLRPLTTSSANSDIAITTSETCSTGCRCRDGTAVLPWMCSVFPMHRFGDSIFSVPTLLFLRLFYQASSCSFNASNHDVHTENPQLAPESLHTMPSQTGRWQDSLSTSRAGSIFQQYKKLTTAEFDQDAERHKELFQSLKIVSVTWIKALASPLSHEFIQFVIEDDTDGARYRLVVDRQDSGDNVVVGWDWSANTYPSHHHQLPLPLVSLSYDQAEGRPSLGMFAKILADVSATQPYNLMREMCWWYAETVFEILRTQHPGHLKEWPFAKLRYSFVVRTSLLQRKTLSEHARAFRDQLHHSMNY